MYSYYNLKNNRGPIKKYNKLIEYSNFIEYQNCRCEPEILKNSSANPNGSYNSRNLRVSQTINSTRGGRIQFGDVNGRPISLNYLGRLEGMFGGGGVPLRNKF
jgi:hypothetical protein